LQSSSVAFFARSLDQFFFFVKEQFINFHSDRPSSSRKASPHFPDSFDVHSVVVLLLVVAGRSVGSRVPLVAVWSTIILLLSAGRLLGWFVFLVFSSFFYCGVDRCHLPLPPSIKSCASSSRMKAPACFGFPLLVS
jgi:hypothetical protein